MNCSGNRVKNQNMRSRSEDLSSGVLSAAEHTGLESKDVDAFC